MRSLSSIRARRRTAAQQLALLQVKRRIGAADPHGRLKYLRDFTEAFVDYDHVMEASELEQLCRQADILLVGDYHALPASQTYAASLLEQLAAGGRPLVLALETVFVRDQRHLNKWSRGEISLDELRGRLRFDSEWGYDWAPFASLLETARRLGCRIAGLDCATRGNMRRIATRDRHAAEKIAELRTRLPESRVVVVFGEAHLAPNHLPLCLRQLRPQDRIITVLQNHDELYWKAAGELTPQARAVRVNQEVACVFNSTPLEKYESYRLYIEKWTTEPGQPDFAPTFYNLVDTLLHSLGLQQYSPAAGPHPQSMVNDYPEVCVRHEPSQFDELLLRRRVAAQDRKLALDKLGQKGCAYIPRHNLLLVERFRLGPAAEEAVRFVQNECGGLCASRQKLLAFSSVEDVFYFQVMDRALMTAGALVLLPDYQAMRRADLHALYDHSAEIVEEQTPFSFDEFTEMLDFLVLHKDFEGQCTRFWELPDLIKLGISSTGKRWDFLVSSLAAMLGAEIHEAYVAGKMSRRYLRSLYFRKVDLPGGARKAYFELANRLAPPRRRASA